MKKTLLRLTSVIAAMIMVFAMSITAFATEGTMDASTAESLVSQYINDNGTLPKGSSAYFTTDSNGLTSAHAFTVNGTQYYISETNLITVGKKLQRTADNDAAITTLNDVTEGMNITADVTTASTMLSGFYPILSTVIGLMVILISIGMTVFSAFDLCYIAFPVFRNHCEDAKQSGSGLMAKTNKSTGETKLRFVTDDAQYAVNAADTTQSGKNPFVIYFGKRLLSYIILAILLFILMTGNITVFTNLALKVVNGVLELIQGI